MLRVRRDRRLGLLAAYLARLEREGPGESTEAEFTPTPSDLVLRRIYI
jgi:hypothetical protein